MPSNNIKVKIITQKGSSSLVEYVDGKVLSRKYIPTSKLFKDAADTEVLKAGIPYGYSWRDINIKFDALKFENEMHNAGLWTVQDVMKSPQKLWSALRATFADNLSEILTLAKVESKGDKHA